MKTLLILSTCICRPSIHKICYTKLFENIIDCTVHFIINIDPVAGLDNISQLDTKIELEKLIHSAGHTSEFLISNKACFYEATKAVTNIAREKMMVNNNIGGILWFEDDKLFQKKAPIKNILANDNCINEVHHFWKKSAQCPTFYPCFWGLNVAMKLFFPAFIYEISRDPELAMMDYWRKNYKVNEYIVYYYISHTKDIGREWQKNNAITKWTREAMNNKNVTYL